jgi:predicted MFS family arabinose efflux permease
MEHGTVKVGTKRWTVLIGLITARIALGFHLQVLAVVGPGVSADLALTNTELGLLIGIFLAPGVVLALPGGALIQRFGEKSVIALSLLVMTGAALVAARGDGFWAMFFARILGGAGGVMITVSAAKTVVDWFHGREINTALAANLTGFPIGVAIALFCLGGFAEPESWRDAFWIAAAAGFGALFVFILTFDAPEKDAAARGLGILGALPNRSESLLIVLIGGVWAIYNGSFMIMLSFTPLFLATEGIPFELAAVLVGLAPMCSLIAVPLGGVIADRLQRPNIIIVAGAALWALAMALLVPFARWPIAVGVLLVAGALAGAPPSGPIVAAAGGVARPQARGVALGLFYTVFYLGSVVTPPLAGWAIDASGSPATGMMMMPALLLLAIVVFAVFHRQRIRLSGAKT